jgi:WD40 repeat protein
MFAFAKDASKFVAAYASVISQSVPHMYLSALPFTPIASRVSEKYLPNYSNTLQFLTGKLDHWPAIQLIMEGHSSSVLSVVFSPDGKQIASGSGDKTIRVWDAETGNVVSGPFEGHTNPVNSVAFSPDGKQIVSGSVDKTICVWDAETGSIVSGPFEGHTDSVRSVSFSPNGKRIVSGSSDKTIRIWDAETGDVVSGPFEGHTNLVSSVVFPCDGKQTTSECADEGRCAQEAENRCLSFTIPKSDCQVVVFHFLFH